MRMKQLLSTIAVAAGLFASGCASTSSPPYAAKWASATTQTLRLDGGVQLRYLKTGKGPALVLLHTIRTQLDYFEQLVPKLEGDYQVYALDLPGHGGSDRPAVEYTEQFMRQAVGEFIAKLDLRDVTLVGESIGGVLALTVPADHPDRIKRVVSLNPYDYGDKFGGGVRRSSNGWMVGLFDVFGSHTIEPKFVTSAVLGGGFYDPSRLPDQLLDEFVRSGSQEGYRRAEYSVFKNWTTWLDARQLYPRVKAPVTLIYGSDDWSSLDERERTQRAFPGGRVYTIEKSGHFTALEKSTEVANIILALRDK